MNKLKFIISVVFPLLLFSKCNVENKENSANDTLNTKKIPPIDSFVQNNFNQNLYLNEGEKWEIKPKMIKYIRKIEKVLFEFEKDTTNNQIEDYSKLSIELSKYIKIVNNDNDMKGKAGEAIYIWILPFTELVDRLAFTKELETSQKLVSEMRVLLKEFNRYFK